MRKNILGALLVLVVLPFAAFAQEDGQAVLDKLSEKIKSLGDYAVEYVAYVEGYRAEGQYIVSGDSYVITVGPNIAGADVDYEIICDGKARFEINHNDEEVIIDNINPDDRNILTNPTRAFDFASDSFKSYYRGTKSIDGQMCDLISLLPIYEGSSLTGIYLSVGVNSGLPVELKYSVDGLDGEVVARVVKFESSQSITQSTFKFDKSKYSEYELVDFR